LLKVFYLGYVVAYRRGEAGGRARGRAVAERRHSDVAPPNSKQVQLIRVAKK